MSLLYNALRRIWQEAAAFNDRVFRHGCDFSRWMLSDQIGFTTERGNPYQPSTGEMLCLLKRYDITEKDAVLDIGCGKGKAMYLMRRFPFGKIDEIDLSPELVSIANSNFARLGETRCHVFAGDAAEFGGYDNYNYFYMFNAMPEKYFALAVKQIEESLRRRPRRCVFVYANPVCADILDKSTLFTLAHTHKSFISWLDSRCYEADPPPTAAQH